MKEMSTGNGRIDEAQIEAILGGGQERVNRYVVTSLAVVIDCVRGLPDETDAKIRAHAAQCQARSRKTLYGLLAACGTCVGLATPYVLRLLGA